jgi:hypothetical protein
VPTPRRQPSHAKPLVAPTDGPTGDPLPDPDPLLDTGPAGLHSFNLGSVPASVTPPRSWRRAAWFMIAASVAALVGLLVATAKLVGPSYVANRIDALPNFPSGVPLITVPQPNSPPLPNGPANRPAPTNNPLGPIGRAVVSAGTGAGPTGVSRSGAGTFGPTGWPATGASPSGSNPSITDTSVPTTTTVSGPGTVTVDPTTLATRTQQFFSEVASNVNAAAGLAAGTVGDDVRAVLRQRYGDISSIRVQSISLDPRTGVTVSLLQLVGKDGSTAVRQATLQFTLGSDPRILNPGG